MPQSPKSENSLWFSFGIEKLGLLALVRPVISALVIIAVSILAMTGVSKISVDDSLSELFRSNSDDFKRYEQVAKRFPSSEYDVLFVVEGQNLLSRNSIQVLRSTILELGLGEAVSGAVSIFSTRRMLDNDGYAAPLFPSELPKGAEFDQLIEELLSNEIVKGKLLSEDGTLTLVVLALDKDIVQEIGLNNSITELKQLISEGFQGTNLSWKLTGAPVMQLEIRNAVQRDRILYNGLGFALGGLIAFYFFRSISLTVIAAAGPAIAVLWALGAVGMMDIRLNLFVNVITPLIMVNGFSDSMHLVYSIRRDVNAGLDRRAAARNAILNVAPACFLTSLTSAVAVSTFIFAQSALIRTFGIAATIAVLIAYVAIVIVVPTMAVFLLPKTKTTEEPKADGLNVLARFSVWLFLFTARRAAIFVALGIVLVLVSGAAYVNLKPHYRLADQVPDKEQALIATERLDEKLSGASPVHVMIEWPENESLYSPTVLNAIADVHNAMEKVDGVGNVWSINSLQRWLKESGNGAPENLKKYVGYLPGHLRNRFLSPESRSALVTGRLPDVDAGIILPVVQSLDKALDSVRAAYPQFGIHVTGLASIAAKNSGRMIWELNLGLVSGMFIVIILLGLAFRSVMASLVSLMPGLIPILFTGALLYIADIGLHFASMIALTVAFGLAVDSTIHFLNRYYLEVRNAEGEETSIEEILSRTAVMIGPVLILTTLVLALGLGVTIMSDLPSLRIFGQLSGIMLVSALLAQLIILPAGISLSHKLMHKYKNRNVGKVSAVNSLEDKS